MNKNWFSRIIALLTLAALVASLLCGCGGGYRSISVASVSGGVSVNRAGQSAGIACYEGMKLQDQDIVTTAKDGIAVLKLDDDKYVYLEPGAQIQIHAAGGAGGTKTEIQLFSGSLSAVIEKELGVNESFSVSVDNVSMVVRGTIFRVSLGVNEQGEPTVTVQTVEGSVGVTIPEGGGTVEASRQDVILLTNEGGTILAANEPTDYADLPPATQDWIRGALEDKLAAASDPEETALLESILESLGGAEEGTTETPLPSPTGTPQATPTEPPVYTLSIVQPEHGRIDAAGGDYKAGATVSLLAVPDDGYCFGGWLVNGGAGSAALGKSVSETLTMPAADTAVSAKFTPVRYTLSIKQPAQGGSVSGTGGKYTPGSRVGLTAVPQSGFTVTGWLINGSVSSALGTDTTVSYRMPEHDVTISAEFAEAYTLTIEQPAQGGTIGGTGGLYVIGAEISLNATPSAGYALTGWIVNGSVSTELGTNPSLIYSMPGADTTFSAEFTKTTHTLSFEQAAQGGGAISMTAGEYASGDTVSIFAAPETDMMLAGLIINGVFDGSFQGQTSMDFTMPDEDVLISAVFQNVI